MNVRCMSNQWWHCFLLCDSIRILFSNNRGSNCQIKYVGRQQVDGASARIIRVVMRGRWKSYNFDGLSFRGSGRGRGFSSSSDITLCLGSGLLFLLLLTFLAYLRWQDFLKENNAFILQYASIPKAQIMNTWCVVQSCTTQTLKLLNISRGIHPPSIYQACKKGSSLLYINRYFVVGVPFSEN